MLIVEADQSLQRTLKHLIDKLALMVILLQATTIENAEQLFTDEMVDIVVISGIALGLQEAPNFVRELRNRGFDGPIIAATVNEIFLKSLAEAGCDHLTQKENIPMVISRLI